MKKRALLVFSLFLINFVSAYYGSYTSFSLSDLLDNIDPSTMILGAVFIISFAFVNFALLKVFKDKYGEPNKATAGVVAFTTSLLITYGINKTGFDFEGLFFNIGISSDLLYTIVPLILLVALIYLSFSKRVGFKRVLIGLGALFIVISFTDVIYSKGTTLLIGIILLGVGIWLWRRGPPSGLRHVDQWRDYRAQKRDRRIEWEEARARKRQEEWAQFKEQRKRRKEFRKAGKLKMENKNL